MPHSHTVLITLCHHQCFGHHRLHLATGVVSHLQPQLQVGQIPALVKV